MRRLRTATKSSPCSPQLEKKPVPSNEDPMQPKKKFKQLKLALKAFTIWLPTIYPRLFPTTSLIESILQPTPAKLASLLHLLINTLFWNNLPGTHIFPSCSALTLFSAFHVMLNEIKIPPPLKGKSSREVDTDSKRYLNDKQEKMY